MIEKFNDEIKRLSVQIKWYTNINRVFKKDFRLDQKHQLLSLLWKGGKSVNINYAIIKYDVIIDVFIMLMSKFSKMLLQNEKIF